MSILKMKGKIFSKSKKIKRFFVFVILTFVSCFMSVKVSQAQDVEQVLKAKKVRVSGSFSANNVNYSAIGINRRREAHTYYLSGNLNISLFDQWTIPLNFTYSNQDVELSHGVSFNQIGLSPSYKWITIHAGYTSMTFSPYSLSGHSFLGLGVDLRPPSKINVSMMYGQLKKAEEPADNQDETLFAYKRMGAGIKLIYKEEGDEFNLIAFGAKDDENSIKKAPVNTEITPKENLVLGINIRKNLFSKFFLGLEYTNSLLTRDTRVTAEGQNSGIFNIAKRIVSVNASSAIYKAIKTELSYQNKDFNVGMQYERVDPGYQTLGAYYFTNDLENISFTIGKQFLKGRVNISANSGLQRNDLKKEKKSSMSNVVGSLNVGIQAGATTNINLSYSNYTSYTNIRSDFDKINEVNQKQVYDTLDFTQVSQNVSLSLSQVLGDIKNSETRQNLNINFNVQIASEKQEGKPKRIGNKFYSSSLTHSISWKSSGISLSSTVNGNYNEMKNGDAFTVGPTLSLSKRFKKNLRSTCSGSWNKSYANGDFVNRVYVIRLSSSYAIKKNNFSLNLNYMNRHEIKKYAEFTATLGYNYSF